MEEQSLADNEGSQKRQIAIMPSMVSIYVGLAQVYAQTNRAEKAEQTLLRTAERVTKEEPTGYRAIMSPFAFDSVAQFYESRGRIADAEKWYARVSELTCNAHAYGVQSQSMERYAKLLRSSGRIREASAMGKKAAELAKIKGRLDASGADY